MTLSERIADRTAAIIGSWRFIITQSGILVIWVIYNSVAAERFDEYPYILLNLFLSVQAAFCGPILLLASNRQSEIDRKRAIKNLMIDQEDHEVIIRLEHHLDRHFHRLAAELNADRTAAFYASKSDTLPPPRSPKSTSKKPDLQPQDQKSPLSKPRAAAPRSQGSKRKSQ